MFIHARRTQMLKMNILTYPKDEIYCICIYIYINLFYTEALKRDDIEAFCLYMTDEHNC